MFISRMLENWWEGFVVEWGACSFGVARVYVYMNLYYIRRLQRSHIDYFLGSACHPWASVHEVYLFSASNTNIQFLTVLTYITSRG